jgi:hypothetical protein
LRHVQSLVVLKHRLLLSGKYGASFDNKNSFPTLALREFLILTQVGGDVSPLSPVSLVTTSISESKFCSGLLEVEATDLAVRTLRLFSAINPLKEVI